MTGASLFRSVARGLLAAGRTAFVLGALVALLHVTAPHDHASVTDEQRCTACQLQRVDGGGTPEADPIPLAPPARTSAPVALAAVDLAPRAACTAPVLSRGPPSPSPSEPL